VRPRGLMQAPHRACGAPAALLRMLRLCCPGAYVHGSFAEAAAPWGVAVSAIWRIVMLRV